MLVQENNVGIEYEYNIVDDTKNESKFTWNYLPWSECTASCAGGIVFTVIDIFITMIHIIYLRSMTHSPETSTRKPVPRKPVPVSCRCVTVMQFDADFFWYRNLDRVRALLYSVEETDTGFLVPVFGTGLWCVMGLSYTHSLIHCCA